MTPEKLAHCNQLQRTMLFLKNAIAAIETLIGLSKEGKESLKAEMQRHHDDAESQFNEA